MKPTTLRAASLLAGLALAAGSITACGTDGPDATDSPADSAPETVDSTEPTAEQADTAATDDQQADATPSDEPTTDDQQADATPADESTTDDAALTVASTGLSEDEIAALMWMRGEEQLARDVYLALDEMWDLRIFENISASEERHIAAVHDLLADFGLDDPSAALPPGTFDDPEIQALYDDLVERGSSSELDALVVGALIEELDIADLREFAAQTDDASILAVYDMLERGSRNHLRAFVSQIEARDGSFEPTVLDDALEIVASPTERGGDAGGGKGRGRGHES
jgi:hypothetical protein